jgi:hypothetical protein
MVGAILISRGIPEDSKSRIAPVESALTTAIALLADTGTELVLRGIDLILGALRDALAARSIAVRNGESDPTRGVVPHSDVPDVYLQVYDQEVFDTYRTLAAALGLRQA